jgi:hypothetical protein
MLREMRKPFEHLFRKRSTTYIFRLTVAAFWNALTSCLFVGDTVPLRVAACYPVTISPLTVSGPVRPVLYSFHVALKKDL